MSNIFYMPSLSFLGKDALDSLTNEVKTRKFKNALVVTDKILNKIGVVKQVTDILSKANIKFSIFDETKPNPTVKNVEDGLRMIKKNKCDFVISLGGGSPHDCAKGIALLATNGGKINDYEGVDKSEKPQLPLIAINTTAGTASEMTRFSIITDEERHIKMAIVDKNITPIVAINDPTLMMGMPKGLTAATGMDALTHSIEAYISTGANPVTDACAEKAIELIVANLRKAVEKGSDKVARENMAYAEFLAGMAFNNASLGYVHAMAHQMGGFYDLPHGVCNAILLPNVIEFCAPKCKDKLVKIAMLFGATPAKAKDPAKFIISEIKKLSRDIGIPKGFIELGAQDKDLPILAKNALKDACGFTSPRKAKQSEIIEIYKKSM